jgi:type VI secretion system secreted protein Hcp
MIIFGRTIFALFALGRQPAHFNQRRTLMDDTKKIGASTIGHHVLVGALAAASTIAATEAVAASDIFVKIGDIKGESNDDKHKDWIDVLAWSWGVSGRIPAVTPGAVQRSCTQPLVITKVVDKATPLLFVNTVLNNTIRDTTLSVRKQDSSSSVDYLVIKFNDVFISSVKSRANKESELLTEDVTLGFTSATITFTPQDSGTPESPIVANLPASCT